MDIHAQAWALRERGMRLGDIAKELHIELRDVAQLLSDKGTQPKRRSEPVAPVAPRTKQHDGAPASTSSAEAQRLKAIADLLACKPAEIEQALDTLTGALADESALREHLQATVARLEARIDARDDDNIALMARLGDLALLLGCGGPDIEQTVADLMSSLAEEIERRDAALESVRLLSEALASERAARASEETAMTAEKMGRYRATREATASAADAAKERAARQEQARELEAIRQELAHGAARIAQLEQEIERRIAEEAKHLATVAKRPGRAPVAPAGWSDWMPPSDLARALGCHPTNVTQAVYSHRSRVRGRAIQARRELTLEERARYGAKRYLVRYELTPEEAEG